MSQIIKISEVYPLALVVPKEQLSSTHVKTIPGLMVDKEPVTRRGKKISKRWYTTISDSILKKPAFCKEYGYSFNDGELTKTTKCIWFGTDGNVFHDEDFSETYSVSVTDEMTSKFRSYLISQLRSDAKGIVGVNGKGDAVRIFKKYKNLIENYIFDGDEAQSWIDAMDNETNNGILNLLNVELPVRYVNNLYEEALSESVIFPLVFNQIGLNPVNPDLTMKTQQEIAIELLGLGLDITDPATALTNIIQYLISEGFDVRVISIKEIIKELITTD